MDNNDNHSQTIAYQSQDEDALILLLQLALNGKFGQKLLQIELTRFVTHITTLSETLLENNLIQNASQAKNLVTAAPHTSPRPFLFELMVSLFKVSSPNNPYHQNLLCLLIDQLPLEIVNNESTTYPLIFHAAARNMLRPFLTLVDRGARLDSIRVPRGFTGSKIGETIFHTIAMHANAQTYLRMLEKLLSTFVSNRQESTLRALREYRFYGAGASSPMTDQELALNNPKLRNAISAPEDLASYETLYPNICRTKRSQSDQLPAIIAKEALKGLADFLSFLLKRLPAFNSSDATVCINTLLALTTSPERIVTIVARLFYYRELTDESINLLIEALPSNWLELVSISTQIERTTLFAHALICNRENVLSTLAERTRKFTDTASEDDEEDLEAQIQRLAL